MVEMSGGRRRAERKREGCRVRRGVRRQEEERRGSHINYQNAPPSLFLFFLVPSCFIFDTASLIRNSNSEPKIDNMTFNQLRVPKNIEVRFND